MGVGILLFIVLLLSTLLFFLYNCISRTSCENDVREEKGETETDLKLRKKNKKER